MPISSIEEACKTLTDNQIEKLLHDKISNMCIYAHYDLAEHGAGLLSQHYNGKKVEFSRLEDDAEPKIIKSAIESNLYVIKLVATAVKTIQSKYWHSCPEYTFFPVYDPYSSFVCGNIIFRNMQTGEFYAMKDWVCNPPSYSINRGSMWGLSQFMRCVAQNRDLRNTVLMDLSTARASHRLQR